ncbi:hypothetical protein ACFQI7_36055 [Paenibacillus allorhizosphaerae]|uniref:hypothetical protein n=1 Tax=Paenibacillus allorhizosphaerae TaxID=2849866 RepID=UPI001C405E00|nr:hypothetical protein [Paenibacillus allorhizosphaerae]
MLVQEAPDLIEPPHTGSAFQVEPGTAFGEILGGLRSAVGQAAVHDRGLARCAVVGRPGGQQCAQQRELDTGLRREEARGARLNAVSRPYMCALGNARRFHFPDCGMELTGMRE